MNKKNLLIILFAAAAGISLFFLLQGDEKKIRRNLDSFAEYCSTKRDDPAIESLKKAALAAKLCYNPCRVEIQSLRIARDFNRKDISDHILLMKKNMASTHFSFHDTEIQFPSDGKATLVTTLRLQGGVKDNRFTDAYEIELTVRKNEGDWLFSSFKVVQFIER